MPKISYKHLSLKSADALALIDQANAILEEYAGLGYDMTLRQLYYRFVALDLFPDDRRWRQLPGTNRWVRDPNGTKNADPNYTWLGDIMVEGRMAGKVDWNHLVDRTRELKTSSHWESPQQIMRAVAAQYSVDKWEGQPYRPEVWIEKDALSGVFKQICEELDVPYFACKGYTSLSEMWRAARRLRGYEQNGQTPIIFHFGDHDPSGIDMTRNIQDRLETFMGGLEVRRLALNMDQIQYYDPPPNPAKITDPRAKSYIENYGDESWELDALEPSVLSSLVEEAVYEIVDEELRDKALKKEDLERRKLAALSNHFDEIGKYATRRGWTRKKKPA